MHHMYLEDMARALIKAGAVRPENEEMAVKILGDCWKGKIAITWGWEDVQGRAEDLDMDISEGTAKEILDRVDNNHDCSYGITWDVIDSYLDEDEYMEESKVRQAERDELPLLINELKTESAKALLAQRLKDG